MTPPSPEPCSESRPAPRPARRRMPLRHKLMLALACEILLVGFRKADLVPARAGILIESPVLPHHAIV